VSGASPEPLGSAVDRVRIGHLGEVSRCWLGTAAFGGWATPGIAECRRVVEAALDLGITAFDSADTYSDGEAERILGRVLASGRAWQRDQVVVATKFGLDHRRSRAIPVTATDVRQALEGSLRRLDVDHVDLYSVHRIASIDQVDVLVPTLQALQDEGKIRAFGTSMATPAALARARELAASALATEQPPYSIFVREIERSVVELCRQDGIAVTAFAPLNGGWLTGKYRPGTPVPPDSRAAVWPIRRDRYDMGRGPTRRKLALVAELTRLGDQAGLSPTRLALGFALSNADVPVTILGARDEAQLRQVLDPAPAPLGTDLREAIDRLVPPGSTIDPLDLLGYRFAV